MPKFVGITRYMLVRHIVLGSWGHAKRTLSNVVGLRYLPTGLPRWAPSVYCGR